MKSRSSACGIGRAYTSMRARPQAMRAEFSRPDAPRGLLLHLAARDPAGSERFHVENTRDRLDRCPRRRVNGMAARQTQFRQPTI